MLRTYKKKHISVCVGKYPLIRARNFVSINNVLLKRTPNRTQKQFYVIINCRVLDSPVLCGISVTGSVEIKEVRKDSYICSECVRALIRLCNTASGIVACSANDCIQS